jgi:hypothetical protein
LHSWKRRHVPADERAEREHLQLKERPLEAFARERVGHDRHVEGELVGKAGLVVTR